MDRQTEAEALKKNQLLPEILEARKADIIQQWEMAATPQQREEAWQALHQLKLLAGAIEDGCKRELGGSRSDGNGSGSD